MRILAFILAALCCASPPLSSQEPCIMFYNTENLFDTANDFQTDDDEFLPVGKYHWTEAKLEQKCNSLCRAIEEAAKGRCAVLVGLCEVENRYVLEQLTQKTSLASYQYTIMHNDSPDLRGIDVALLYQPARFRLLDSTFIRADSDTLPKATRDILYAKGILDDSDTLHVFVNHWPSKREGEKLSEPYRMQAARILRGKVDSLLNRNGSASIIAIGDFNDTPDSRPTQVLTEGKGLHNLSAWRASNGEGTSKYRGQWQLVDMMLCSTAMLDSLSSIHCNLTDYSICTADFLLEPDKTYGGNKPKRTFTGLRYNGGASDHLPVVLTLHRR